MDNFFTLTSKNGLSQKINEGLIAVVTDMPGGVILEFASGNMMSVDVGTHDEYEVVALKDRFFGERRDVPLGVPGEIVYG